MSIQQFTTGSGAPVIRLTAFDPTSSAGLAASVFFNTNGSVDVLQGGVTTTYTDYWVSLNPNPLAALYEIRRTQTSGSIGVTFTGTMTSTTWYPLTSQRGVTVVASPSVNRSNVSTWDIRLAGGDGTILATVVLTVTSNF